MYEPNRLIVFFLTRHWGPEIENFVNLGSLENRLVK